MGQVTKETQALHDAIDMYLEAVKPGSVCRSFILLAGTDSLEDLDSDCSSMRVCSDGNVYEQLGLVERWKHSVLNDGYFEEEDDE